MSDELLIKFDGDLHQVDANTLINSLACIVTIVNEVTQEVSPEHRIDIKIKAISKGSFVVNLEFITQLINDAQSLLTKENLEILSEVVAILGGVFGLRKFLKGKRPKEIKENEQKVDITNSDGNQLVLQKNIYNIYNSNININEALNNNFESLNNDPSINSYKLTTSDNNSIFEVDKKEFSELVYQEKIEEILPEEKIIKLRTFLHIFKIVFDNKYKWEFIYRGDKISANVQDEDFFKKIDLGEKFSKGDTLEVELEITQSFDKGANTYLNRCYKIIRVFSHIPRAEQGKLDFEEN